MTGEFATAALTGEIDMSNASTVGDQTLSMALTDAPGLIVDLSSVSFIDSAGIRMLFDLVRRLHDRRQLMTIALPQSSLLQRLMKITGIGETVPVRDTVEECAEWMREAQTRRLD